MRPSRIPTLRTASSCVSGSITRPPSITTSYVGSAALTAHSATKLTSNMLRNKFYPLRELRCDKVSRASPTRNAAPLAVAGSQPASLGLARRAQTRRQGGGVTKLLSPFESTSPRRVSRFARDDPVGQGNARIPPQTFSCISKSPVTRESETRFGDYRSRVTSHQSRVTLFTTAPLTNYHSPITARESSEELWHSRSIWLTPGT